MHYHKARKGRKKRLSHPKNRQRKRKKERERGRDPTYSFSSLEMTDCLSEVCPPSYIRGEKRGRREANTHKKRGGEETPINNANGGSGAAKVAFYMLCLSEGKSRVSPHPAEKSGIFLPLLVVPILLPSSSSVRKLVLRQRQVCPFTYEALFFKKNWNDAHLFPECSKEMPLAISSIFLLLSFSFGRPRATKK